MTITGEEIIHRYCMGMLNPSPDYYAGRGNNVRDLNSSILELLYGGIKTEVGPESAKMFVNMVKNLKNTNAQNFLLEYYRMERKGWRWSEPVMKVRVKTDTAAVEDAAPRPVKKPAETLTSNGVEYNLDGTPVVKRGFVEIANAFLRSGSLFGHDKTITGDFLARHKDEVEKSAIVSSFGGG